MSGRRRFIQLLTAMLGGFAIPGAAASYQPQQNPFTLGVASGSPLPDGVVLWTRLAPNPLSIDHPTELGGMPAMPIRLQWEVARDPQFKHPVKTGTAVALPDLAHSVHVEVSGLEPGAWYFYRFRLASHISPTGRTRTAPAPDSEAPLRMAYASCQHYEHGFFGAYQHMLREELDLVAFLGDYIYEYKASRDPKRVRRHPPHEAITLNQYRERHALYKLDPDLQAMHAAVPWVLIWDDHEVANDYANDQAQDLAADFLARRAAAYQAYFEHQPLRPSRVLTALTQPTGRFPGNATAHSFESLRVYDTLAWGKLAQLYMLDDRQYRDYQACPRPNSGGSNTVNAAACPALRTPTRSMLGAVQEAWLNRGLADTRTNWTLFIQQTLFSPLNQQSPAFAAHGPRVWTDGWEGYPAARQRLLKALQDYAVPNPVFFGGDVHANWVCDVTYQERILATEFCGTSLTSPSWPQSQTDAVAAQNSHVKLANSALRGYGVMTLEPARMTVTLRVLDDVTRHQPAISTLATFDVLAGQPGASTR
ncbi:alkaline phosphatase [Parvibium lacunae]|uniref:Alkaline phosphatase n=2 Tax=Parvibium lacunae TaxID=1888893 RepID=A0A368L222_9BURK|nr:alkaline phosphatase [Parvibium lacunae]